MGRSNKNSDTSSDKHAETIGIGVRDRLGPMRIDKRKVGKVICGAMTDRELLVEHLSSALEDAAAGRDDYFEVAALAGLLVRFAAVDRAAASPAEQEVLAKAQALRAAGTLRASLPQPAAATDIAEQFSAVPGDAVPGDYDEQDKRDMLLDLDELCAGAWFVGAPAHFAAATREVAAAIHTHPDLWREQSLWVARVLASAPPLPADPMLAIFRLIATSAPKDASAQGVLT